MYIENLTEDDCRLLDEIWALDTRAELDAYMNTLTSDELQRAWTLIEMVKLSATDEIVESMDTYPEAEMLLQNIMN